MISYKIKECPDGQWRLLSLLPNSDVWLDGPLFPCRCKAEAGMYRTMHPMILFYNENGNPVSDFETK